MSSLSPATKLVTVVAVQFLILLSIIGFKQYTVWTGETVLLETTPVDPRGLLRGDVARVQYEISTIDLTDVAGDDVFGGEIYVELQRDDNGYWSAAAVHGGREHSFDGTALIKGDATYRNRDTISVDYGIEQAFVPEGSGDELPFGGTHTVAVEVRVDRYGNAVPRRFFVDGKPFDLSR